LVLIKNKYRIMYQLGQLVILVYEYIAMSGKKVPNLILKGKRKQIC